MTSRRVTVVVFSALLVLSACAASTPGAHPHDMSATGHEAEAKEEDREAAAHRAQFVPDASVAVQKCEPMGATRLGGNSGVCWTSRSNPSAIHLEEAAKHRKMAADHRAASQALRDAETRACVGISDDDRDESPFDQREDISSVEAIPTGAGAAKGAPKTEGAIVNFRAVPGMTAPWLQRVVDCHLARNAALGFDVPEMPYCPLVPKGVTAHVTATATGFAVAMRSEDPKAAEEVLRRARALVTH